MDNNVCSFCHSADTKIIVSLKFMAKCKDCGEYTELHSSSLGDFTEFEVADEELFNKIYQNKETK